MKMLVLSMLLGVTSLTGCASFMKFQVPQEFEGGKVKEDPPGTMLPLPHPELKTC